MCGIWALFSNCTIPRDCYNWFMTMKHRGPNNSFFIEQSDYSFAIGFHRLSIMDMTSKGDQPFIDKSKVDKKNNTIYCICNGEIYNYQELISKYNLTTTSNSDCEILISLYKIGGIELLINEITGEFAFVLIDGMTAYVARDSFGVRPIFYYHGEGGINISSELKGLMYKGGEQFPPSHYMKIQYDSTWTFTITQYYSCKIYNHINDSLENIQKSINKILSQSVHKRLKSNRPLGCLLSGGLDSSLVASIAAKYLYPEKLHTFSIGMEGSTDEYYANLVAKYIGSEHTHIKFDASTWLESLQDIVYCTETYDITTIRATTGQYLISKWISENTDIKVLLIGDGSDELCSGYLYFHKAPTPEDAHKENIHLLENIHYFDVLRADRGIAYHGLEARVPFLDRDFVDYYLSVDPKLRIPINEQEKWLLRSSFKGYLPDEVLYRKKSAFSDSVSGEKLWYQHIQEYLNKVHFDNVEYLYNAPQTKEALYYRKIFENFYGSENEKVVPFFWLPKWCGKTNEPSACALKFYNSIGSKSSNLTN